jgi:cytochrome oxidase Cu insertion factor (SCO1/SenC/PrrC family)
MIRRGTVALVAVAGVLVLLGTAAWVFWPRTPEPAVAAAPVPIGGPFELVDHHGQPVSDEAFRDRLMLVFFGYTWCPDFCPMTVQDLSLALDQLDEAQAEQVAFLFITVDPKRDTPEQLASWVEHFHPRLIGLTGSEEAIAATARAYRVYYAKQAMDGTEEYLMDHSTIVYLMDREGGYLTHFGHDSQPEEIAATLREHL